MSDESILSRAVSPEALDVVRRFAVRDARNSRVASAFWLGIWIAGLLAYVVLIAVGGFSRTQIPEVVLPLFGIFLLAEIYNLSRQTLRDSRTLATVQSSEPRQLILEIDRLPDRRKRFQITLRDDTGVCGTAYVQKLLARAPRPGVVLAFGELSSGHDVVCVSPELGLARYRLTDDKTASV